MKRQQVQDYPKKIRHALIAIMAGMPYDKIRVNHILEEAGTSRNTFYRNYANKDEVLKEIIDGTFDHLNSLVEEMYKNSDINEIESHGDVLNLLLNDLYIQCYLAIKQHQNLYRILLTSGVDEFVYEGIRRAVIRLLGKFARIQGISIKNPDVLDYLSEHLSGSYFSVMRRWTKDGMRYAPEKLAVLQSNLLNPFIINKLIAEETI